MNFGIEIEVAGASAALANKLQSVTGYPVDISDDGSIRDRVETWNGVPIYSRRSLPRASASRIGLEVSTRILSERRAEDFCRKAGNFLARFPSDRRAAIHIHVDVRGWAWRQVRNVILAFHRTEALWYRLGGLGEVHRGIYNNFMYCRPISSSIAAFDNGGLIRRIIDVDRLYEAEMATEFAAAWGRMDRFWSPQRHYIPHRLHGINFASVSRLGSLEFRVFNAVYKELPLAFDKVRTFVYNTRDREITRDEKIDPKEFFDKTPWKMLQDVALPDDMRIHHYRDVRIPFNDPLSPIYNGREDDDGLDTFPFYVA